MIFQEITIKQALNGYVVSGIHPAKTLLCYRDSSKEDAERIAASLVAGNEMPVVMRDEITQQVFQREPVRVIARNHDEVVGVVRSLMDGTRLPNDSP